VRIFPLVIWSISASFAILYFNSEICYETKGRIYLIPFLYLYLLFFIFQLPILNFNVKQIKAITSNSSLEYIIYIVAICGYLPFIEHIIEIVRNFKDINNFGMKAIEREEIADARYYMSYIGARLNSVTLYVRHISPILFFYYLSCKKKHILILLGLTASVLSPTLFSFSIGSRGSAVVDSISFLFLYFLFKDFLNHRIKKIITISFLCTISVWTIILVAITVVRFDNLGYNISEWYYRYLGESFINFNGDLWYIKDYAWGDMSVPDLG
jgi:oligosaccharide repeat unit polymerase